MSSPSDPHSILSRGRVVGDAMRAPKPKIARYRPGQAPTQADEAMEDEEENIFPNSIDHYTINSDRNSIADSSRGASMASRVQEEDVGNRRRRVHRTVVVEENNQNDNDMVAEAEAPVERERSRDLSKARRRVVEETIEGSGDGKTDQDEDNIQRSSNFQGEAIEEVVSRRRGNIKEQLLEREEVKEVDPIFSTMREDDEESEEDDDDEEDDEYDTRARQPIKMLKPVYVHRHERDTQQEQIDEEIALQEENEKIKKRKKEETQTLFLEAIREDNLFEQDAKNKHMEESMPPDDDNENDANEYQLWKIRELRRIKRDREDKYKLEREKAEIERRRRLTDQERMEEDKRLGSDATDKPERRQMNFMQKYYHKGAFYQDNDDPIFRRDFNAAVGEDARDKSTLPSVLQVRRGDFGKAGRSKWKHLTAEDTTNFDPLWKVNEDILAKNVTRMAGYKQQAVVDRPSFRKK